MILVLTDKCSMGCTHCLSDCKPDGQHITLEQFKQNLEFALRTIGRNPHILLLSGGEPFEHPQIKEIVEYAAERLKKLMLICTIASNGAPLIDNKELYNWYKELAKKYKRLFLQVTNVPKYYPRTLTSKEIYWLEKIKNCVVVTDEKYVPLYPQGRALNLPNPEWRTKGPKCSDIRLVTAQKPGSSFGEVINTLFGLIHKSCTPRINIDGSIVLGESRLCPKVANVTDSDPDIIKAVREFKCHGCQVCLDIMKQNNPVANSLFNMINE
jgi:organic radical activating enzyme